MILFAEDRFSSYIKNVFGLRAYQESITQDFFVVNNNKDQQWALNNQCLVLE